MGFRYRSQSIWTTACSYEPDRALVRPDHKHPHILEARIQNYLGGNSSERSADVFRTAAIEATGTHGTGVMNLTPSVCAAFVP
jgi:hypothetical protein